MLKKAVIGIFYNRPDQAKIVLNALVRNDGLDRFNLCFFCDVPEVGADPEQIELNHQVQSLLTAFAGHHDCRLSIRTRHVGLYDNITSAIDEVFETHDAVVVLEDDILLTTQALKYFDATLEQYSEDERVAGIAANTFMTPDRQARCPDTYWLPIGSSWGWATWKSRWLWFDGDRHGLLNRIDTHPSPIGFDFGGYPYRLTLSQAAQGLTDSWAILFYASFYLRGAYFIFPKYSFCENIGFGKDGTHCLKNDPFAPQVDRPGFYPGDLAKEPDAAIISLAEESFRETLALRDSEGSRFSRRVHQFFNRIFP